MRKFIEILAPVGYTERVGIHVGWRMSVVTSICCLAFFISGVPLIFIPLMAIVMYAILAM